MRFKYNPWVSMVALLLLTAILVLACTGCTTGEAAEPTRLSCQNGGYAADGRLYIITDTETGVQYLLVKSGDGVALTKLEE